MTTSEGKRYVLPEEVQEILTRRGINVSLKESPEGTFIQWQSPGAKVTNDALLEIMLLLYRWEEAVEVEAAPSRKTKAGNKLTLVVDNT